MASVARAKKITDLPSITSALANDLIVVCDFATASTGNSVAMTINNLFSSVKNISTKNMILQNNSTPANSSATVSAGAIWSDGQYLYYAVGNNQIVRALLLPF